MGVDQFRSGDAIAAQRVLENGLLLQDHGLRRDHGPVVRRQFRPGASDFHRGQGAHRHLLLIVIEESLRIRDRLLGNLDILNRAGQDPI